MSTDYMINEKDLLFQDLLNALDEMGLVEVPTESSTDIIRCLAPGGVPGRFNVWVYADSETGKVDGFTTYAGNHGGDVINAIADHFNLEIIDEHQQAEQEEE